jgi:hypothetical protein
MTSWFHKLVRLTPAEAAPSGKAFRYRCLKCGSYKPLTLLKP